MFHAVMTHRLALILFLSGLSTLGWAGPFPVSPASAGTAEVAAEPAPRPEAKPLADEDCMQCHIDKDLRREEGKRKGSSVAVPSNVLAGTPHEGMACIDCHADVKEVPHAATLAEPACGHCHDEPVAQMKASIHGAAAAAGNPDAPGCADCHGKHRLLPKSHPDSLVHPKHVAATCAGCHSNPEVSKRNHFNVADPLKAYEQSVHFAALERGKAAATCAECHGHHDIRKSADPASHTFKSNIPKTCGRCHVEVEKVYNRSVHGQALARGVTDSPSCADCHGEHDTRAKDDPKSMVSPMAISRTTCPRCHDNARMMSKYGIEASKLGSYDDTYHGLALKGGLLVTANCASCHGIHDILPMSDPDSSIHPKNLVSTCGKCHPKANENFTRFTVHAGSSPRNAPEWIIEIVRWVYLALIFLTIGGMLAHNAMIYFHYLRRKIAERRAQKTYVRFTPFEVANHFVLIVTFVLLCLTGFALKFPDSWWVKALSWLGFNERLRGVTHRVAGVILILQGIAHFSWTLATPKGRRDLWELTPGIVDVKDLFHNIFYHLGLVKSHPHFARYSYIEKSEYWAMVWGTFIMGVTGLMLWFSVQVSWFAPAWVVKVAEVIHYYEAWPAMLAILVWRMFFTSFHPEEYPLSLTWLDGKITERELHRHHRGEYEKLKREEEEKKGGEPEPPKAG